MKSASRIDCAGGKSPTRDYCIRDKLESDVTLTIDSHVAGGLLCCLSCTGSGRSFLLNEIYGLYLTDVDRSENEMNYISASKRHAELFQETIELSERVKILLSGFVELTKQSDQELCKSLETRAELADLTLRLKNILNDNRDDSSMSAAVR